MGHKDNKIAVFEDGDAILIAQAGEVVEKDFVVVEFKYDSILMGYTDEQFTGQTTELESDR